MCAQKTKPERLNMSLDEIIAQNAKEHAPKPRHKGRVDLTGPPKARIRNDEVWGGSREYEDASDRGRRNGSEQGYRGGHRGYRNTNGSHRAYRERDCSDRGYREHDQPFVRLTYAWETIDGVETFRAVFFQRDLVKANSNGEVTLDSGGYRNYRTLLAMNAVLSSMRITIRLQVSGDIKSSWTVMQTEGKWEQPFQDCMTFSAFPLRAWRSIKGQLAVLPEVVSGGTSEPTDGATGVLGKRAPGEMMPMPPMMPMPMFPFGPLAFMQLAAMAPLMQRAASGDTSAPHSKVQRVDNRPRQHTGLWDVSEDQEDGAFTR